MKLFSWILLFLLALCLGQRRASALYDGNPIKSSCSDWRALSSWNKGVTIGSITFGSAALWLHRVGARTHLVRFFGVASVLGIGWIGYALYRQKKPVSGPSSLPTVLRQPLEQWELEASGEMTMKSQIEALVSRDGSAAIPLQGGWVALGLTSEQAGMLRKSKSEYVVWEKSFIPWKLHIAADPQNAAHIISAIRGVLWHFSPFCKVLENEGILQEFNTFTNFLRSDLGRYKAGRLLTIYARSEKEILDMACALDGVLSRAIQRGEIPFPLLGTENHTDRPIGATGHLYSRHGQAGAPLTTQAFREGDTATAQEGNYCITRHFDDVRWFAKYEQPIEAPEVIEQMERDRVVHCDIFEKEWGVVRWDTTQKRFVKT